MLCKFNFGDEVEVVRINKTGWVDPVAARKYIGQRGIVKETGASLEYPYMVRLESGKWICFSAGELKSMSPKKKARKKAKKKPK